MSAPTEFDIGAAVACSDGPCGRVDRVVVDPVKCAITHLVVEPEHQRGAGRLVPLDQVASAGPEIQLTCSRAEFDAFAAADEALFSPGAGGHEGYDENDVLRLPYYSVFNSTGGIGVPTIPGRADPHATTYDRVPAGEVEIHRGEHVEATDGPIGRIKGLGIDPSDHHVTHIVLDEGHLWGEKTVAIPIVAVTRVGEVIRLTLSKDEVRDLPAVELDR